MATRVAADLGNTTLGTSLSAAEGVRIKLVKYLFYHSRSFTNASCPSGVVLVSKKVNDEFVELQAPDIPWITIDIQSSSWLT